MARFDRRTAGRVLLLLGITALVIAPALLLYAHQAQATVRRYQEKGVTTGARVLDKGWTLVPWPEGYVRVSFWTAPLLEGGQLIVADIKPVDPASWESLQAGEEIEVVYLSGNPAQVLLSASLHPSGLAPAARYELGLGVLAAGGLLVAVEKGLGGRLRP